MAEFVAGRPDAGHLAPQGAVADPLVGAGVGIDPDAVQPESIEIIAESDSLAIGESMTLSAVLQPENARYPMLVTLSVNSIAGSPLQPWNALTPIVMVNGCFPLLSVMMTSSL